MMVRNTGSGSASKDALATGEPDALLLLNLQKALDQPLLHYQNLLKQAKHK
jgi:hypothetical protein